MTPTIKLGPWDSPSLEFAPRDIYPLIVLMLEEGGNPTLSSDELDSVRSFLMLDSIYLEEETVKFFANLEKLCARIIAGEFARYSIALVRPLELASYLRGFEGEGEVTPRIKSAAENYLRLLKSHPEYWPVAS